MYLNLSNIKVEKFRLAEQYIQLSLDMMEYKEA